MCTQLHRKIALSKVFKLFKVSTFTCFKLLLNKLYVFDMASKSSESKVVEVLSRERNSQSTICLFQVISNSYTQGKITAPSLHLRPCTVSVDSSTVNGLDWVIQDSLAVTGEVREQFISFAKQVEMLKRNVRIIIITTAMIMQAIVIRVSRFKRKIHFIPICKVIKLYIQHCIFFNRIVLTESSSKNSW